MKRQKKTPPPEKETLAPGIDRIAFGKDFTEGSRLEITIPPASADAIKNFGIKLWRMDLESTVHGTGVTPVENGGWTTE